MTTVVCNRDMMASDSQLTGTHKAAAKKMWKFKDGIVGIAGEYAACVQFVRWLQDPEETDEPEMENVDAMVLTKDGRIFHYNGSLLPFEVEDEFSAIGSGTQAAMAAMYMGACPERAIEIACAVDPGTGGRVQVHKITKRKR